MCQGLCLWTLTSPGTARAPAWTREAPDTGEPRRKAQGPALSFHRWGGAASHQPVPLPGLARALVQDPFYAISFFRSLNSAKIVTTGEHPTQGRIRRGLSQLTEPLFWFLPLEFVCGFQYPTPPQKGHLRKLVHVIEESQSPDTSTQIQPGLTR